MNLRDRYDWLDDRRDRRKDDVMSGRRKVRFEKLRWRLAEWVDDRRPGSCWASGGAEFGLGWTNTLTADNTRCRESARNGGSCYCGKVIREDVAPEMLAVGNTPRVIVSMPKHGDRATCFHYTHGTQHHSQTGLTYLTDHRTGGWWAHDIHPADDHEAVPS